MKKLLYTNFTVDELVEEFIEAAIDLWNAGVHYDEDGKPDVRGYNRAVSALAGFREEIGARDALPRLLPLVEHEHLGVRMRAASACMLLDPQRFLPMFEAWDKSDDQHTRVEAFSSLTYWKTELTKLGKLPGQNTPRARPRKTER